MAGRRKRYEEVAEHIELLIFSGKLPVGRKIPSERELMSAFGVGRSTVREALFTLQRKGLLSARGGAAAQVARPTADTLIEEVSGAARHMLNRPDGMRQLQSARKLFEVGLAREAALHASADDLIQLQAALDANGAASDLAEFQRTDMLFHYTLALIAHNPVFTSFHHALSSWLAEQRAVSALAGATRTEMFEQHRAIYNGIAAREVLQAQAAMERHLDNVAIYYWRAMGPEELRRPGLEAGDAEPDNGSPGQPWPRNVSDGS